MKWEHFWLIYGAAAVANAVWQLRGKKELNSYKIFVAAWLFAFGAAAFLIMVIT